MNVTSSVQHFRDRDELLVALRAARAGEQEAQQKEWSACFQVKQAVQMVEEANLYKAQVRFEESHVNSSSYDVILASLVLAALCLCRWSYSVSRCPESWRNTGNIPNKNVRLCKRD